VAENKSKRYLRRRCHICGHLGDVPKTTDNIYRDPTRWVFYAPSPYQQELAEEDWWNWWCKHCIDQDALDI
jgi:hypothetical protein